MAIPKVNKEECTGCEECVEECPAEAIKIVDDVAVIDAGECTECSACVDTCPAEALTEDD
ncbi:MAG: 4Fe-4S dicluster domain-containing protein [Deltaproteobacteria bacterium]|nr:4Fe-4S dicluster domain-containing protein [Deltaproteobacteria bacterium]